MNTNHYTNTVQITIRLKPNKQPRKRRAMTNRKKPGQNTKTDGGIYQEVGPRGGKKENYATVRDGEKMPPTSQAGHSWEQIHRTPNSKR